MLPSLDTRLIKLSNAWQMPMARIALATIFIWFGALKVIGASPANPLVASLLEHTLPGISFATFIWWFGILEVLIGIAFLIPGLERIAIGLLIPHMGTTLLPLILLPQITWSGFLMPTLEGQYIIKNLALIACALEIGAHLTPRR
jgi:uncharacterized membrane protein YkgB